MKDMKQWPPENISTLKAFGEATENSELTHP